ncbi:MAG TPA: hypothetical protein VFV38_15745 [Ktedonobacteraceae bacterium]|nr:hypothetical protein [Ktedonobacteraceae bacterium]
MNEQKPWLDHTVYRVYRNEAGSWEAVILVPTSQTPIIFTGEETPEATVKQVEGTHGGNAEQLAEEEFQAEITRRTSHTPEMLALLRSNWTERDLSEWHVYGSILRPMTGIRIEGTVYLNGNGARYEGCGGRYEIYTYVVSKEPLAAETLKHYTLVEISHP